MDPGDLLKFCQKSARELRELLRENEEGWGERVKMGADGTPTSKVDQIAESFLINSLEEEEIEVNVLSEEIGFLDKGSNVTLVLDPIDGTTNAIWGIPFYGVSFAFGFHSLDDVFFGYVMNLATGDEYYAIKGKGSYMNGKKISPKRGSPLQGLWMNYRVIKSSEVLERISERLKGKARILGAASLELCLVATGALSFYYYPLERLRVVDIAAGQLIVKEVGGRVLRGDLSPLKMNFDLKERSSVFAFIGDLNEGGNLRENRPRDLDKFNEKDRPKAKELRS